MFPVISLGLAAILLTLGVIMMLVGSLKEFGILANAGTAIVFLLDLLVCALLVFASLS